MRNLLSAGFVRLSKSKAFWLSCLLLTGITVASIWTRYMDGVRYGYHSNLDSAFTYYVVFIVFFIPVVCALFVGVEHADGAIRNKLVCGHSRGAVYLSNLTVCSAASLIMCTFAVVPGLCVGLPLLGGFDRGPVGAVLFFIGVYTLSLVWTALSTLLAMLVSNRTISVVAALSLSLALGIAGAYVENRLEARPTIQGLVITTVDSLTNLQDTTFEEYPNPAYLPEGPVRDVFQFLSDLTPGGQTVQYSKTVDHPEVLMAYDAVLFVLTTGAGLVLFKRKDLK